MLARSSWQFIINLSSSLSTDTDTFRRYSVQFPWILEQIEHFFKPIVSHKEAKENEKRNENDIFKNAKEKLCMEDQAAIQRIFDWSQYLTLSLWKAWL